MKYEWKKSEKALYLPKTTPEFVEVGKFSYIVISGEGNPNSKEFEDKIAALYAIAYGVKMTLKKTGRYDDYTVYPLEGLWDLKNPEKDLTTDKDAYVYDIMIRQPDFVREEFFKECRKVAYTKKKNHYIPEVRFESYEDGRCVQMMHIGSYDNEPASFAKMKDYIRENGYELRMRKHREIYISNFLKVEPSKLKTVLRYFVK